MTTQITKNLMENGMGEFLVLYNMGSNCKKVKGCDGMAEVEVIRAADGPVARRRDIEGKGVRLDRMLESGKNNQIQIG